MNIKIKRVYEPPARGDGQRVLVDRVWPRGVSRDAAKLDDWLKDVAPSAELRKWFGHDPAKWSEFRRGYRAELAHRDDALKPLLERARRGTLTLLFGARDEAHNQAVVLCEWLQEQLVK